MTDAYLKVIITYFYKIFMKKYEEQNPSKYMQPHFGLAIIRLKTKWFLTAVMKARYYCKQVACFKV